MTHLQAVADNAIASGNLTAEQHAELLKLAAFDWQAIIKLIPTLVMLFPPLAPFAAIISAVLPFILQIINGGGGATPVPVPGPNPVPNPSPIPTPH